jgi:hypothetical protein
MGSAQVGVTAPDLVVVSPGVQVIADYDEPIFFSDNYYWRNTGGTWYRSTNYSGGWGRVEVAPVAIRSIERPAAYVHYHGEARASAPARGPEVRDHRDDERKEERKDERKEEHNERKEEHNERKDEHKDKQHGHK